MKNLTLHQKSLNLFDLIKFSTLNKILKFNIWNIGKKEENLIYLAIKHGVKIVNNNIIKKIDLSVLIYTLINQIQYFY